MNTVAATDKANTSVIGQARTFAAPAHALIPSAHQGEAV